MDSTSQHPRPENPDTGSGPGAGPGPGADRPDRSNRPGHPGPGAADGPAGDPVLQAAAEGVARLLDGVRKEQLGDPTPCPDYAVRELLAHLVGLATAFRDAGRKDLGPATDSDPQASLPVLDDDWRTLLPLRLDELAEAWARPGAREGQTRAGGLPLPADIAWQVAVNELVVHGWDLARATGQAYAPAEAALHVSQELMRPSGDDPGRKDMFGPVVEVSPGAPLLDRVIGLNGRSPAWTARS